MKFTHAKKDCFLVSDISEADQVPRDLPLEQHGPPAEAAARPLPLQPLALDTHSGGCAGQSRVFNRSLIFLNFFVYAAL